MAAKATFDLDNLLVIFDKVAPDGNGKVAIDTQVDIYSDAKEVWQSSALYPGFEFPFTTIGGNDLGGGLAAGDYYFLRTDLGWRLRPYEADHELTVTGNLYPIDANDPLVVPTSTAYTVPVIFERSQLTQTVTPTTSVVVSAVVSATVDTGSIASAVWSDQSQTGETYGSVVAATASSVSIINSQGASLTSAQLTMLTEIYDLMGLDPTKPLVATPSSRTAGASVVQTITGDPETAITVTRTP